MTKNYKIPILLFVLGVAVTILGVLFKIMEWQFSSPLLAIGMGLEVLAIILLIYKYKK
jgi:uncharacterized membrane protein